MELQQPHHLIQRIRHDSDPVRLVNPFPNLNGLFFLKRILERLTAEFFPCFSACK